MTDDSWETLSFGNDSREANADFLENIYSGRSFVKDETRIVLIGKTGSGKSATGNTLAGRKAFESRFSASSITQQCRQEMVRRFDRHIQIVDTPGLFDTGISIQATSKEIMKCVAMTSPGIHAIVLVTRLNRFTEEEQKTVEHFMKVFGKDVLNYMVILFTGKDDLDSHGMTIEDYLKTSPGPLQKLIAECRGRYFVVNNHASDSDKERWSKGFLEEVDKLVWANGGRCYTTEMYRRAEALMKRREDELKRKIEEEKRAERELIEQNIKVKYDQVTQDQEEKMRKLQTNLQDMAKKEEEEKERHQRDVLEMAEKIRKAEDERRQIAEDRKKWEEERRKEMEKHEKDRNEAMLKMMDRMEEERKKREDETNERMEKLEAERREREAEMRKIQYEKETREREYQDRMAELEKQKQKEFEKLSEEMRNERERMNRRIEEMARNTARIETSDEKSDIFAQLLGGIKKIGSFFGFF